MMEVLGVPGAGILDLATTDMIVDSSTIDSEPSVRSKFSPIQPLGCAVGEIFFMMMSSRMIFHTYQSMHSKELENTSLL